MDELNAQPESLSDLLKAEREVLCEQFAAAWQLQLDTVMHRLEADWRELVNGTLERRFAGMQEAVHAHIERVASTKADEREERLRTQVRNTLTGQISQAGRRLEQAEDTGAWAAALLDGARLYAPQVLLIELAGTTARVAAARTNEPDPEWNSGRPWPSLIQSAVDGQDTVVALASAAELGESLSRAVHPLAEDRAVAVPVVAGRSEAKRRVAAVLIGVGAGAEVDAGGLELLATLAGTALDCRLAAQRATTAAPAGVLMGIAASAPVLEVPAGAGVAPWREEELQARAQRFARVKVAEMRLYRPEAVLQGRASKDLYATLHDEIERGREEYQQQFGALAVPNDYFHEEILRTLAHDDASLLGPGYPGPRA